MRHRSSQARFAIVSDSPPSKQQGTERRQIGSRIGLESQDWRQGMAPLEGFNMACTPYRAPPINSNARINGARLRQSPLNGAKYLLRRVAEPLSTLSSSCVHRHTTGISATLSSTQPGRQATAPAYLVSKTSSCALTVRYSYSPMATPIVSFDRWHSRRF